MATPPEGSQRTAAPPAFPLSASSSPGLHSFKIKGVVFTVDTRYTPVRSLGTGAYGAVCSADDSESAGDEHRRVAIKKVTRAFDDLVDSKRILREMKLLRHFRHENIVGLRDMVPPGRNSGSFEDVYMVLDYMETDLHRIIHSRNTLTDEHVMYFVYQILRALKYIHSANVIHRDLKPSNVLINGNCDLKICDFGLARGFREGDPSYELSEYVVTRWYRAPEIMCASQQYDAKIDVWSLGCIMAEIMGREPIFPGDDYLKQVNLIISKLGTPSAEDMEIVTTPEARKYILRQRRREPVPLAHLYPDAPPLCIDLLSRMLVFDPRKRISVDEALAHPYLARYRDVSRERVCPTPFNFDFERIKMTKPVLQAFMMEEIAAYRPDCVRSPAVAPHLDACAHYHRRVREEVRRAEGARRGAAVEGAEAERVAAVEAAAQAAQQAATAEVSTAPTAAAAESGAAAASSEGEESGADPASPMEVDSEGASSATSPVAKPKRRADGEGTAGEPAAASRGGEEQSASAVFRALSGV